MKKEEALRHLYEHVCLPALEERVAALESFFLENKERLVEDFVQSIRQIAIKIKTMQEHGAMSAIGFLHYSLLRTAVLDGSNYYLIEAYTDKWYWEAVECFGSYDAGWAFQGIPSLLQLLDEQRKKYIGVLDTPDVERLILKELDFFAQFVTALVRLSIPEVVKLPEYQQLNKAQRFQIRVGEFKDISEPVYVEDRLPREEQEARRLLEQTKGSFCTHETFANMRLRQLKANEMDLRYTDFSRSDLGNSEFRHCVLIGTRWGGSSLANADFRHSLLCDADFRRSDLRGVHFSYADEQASDDRLYRQPGLLGIRFDEANLEGADFRHARLYKASFYGANLRQAMFLERDQDRFDLTEAQRKEIRWTAE
ncbi:pentapeptide repeat-containing protein [Brevibacillus agri]|uniref:pentapeptide repeat-containing protein n=1 Tax=Brevibacillus agri TaxID=51101 RepID=UPI0024BF286E|nr:pentapeptide repeat-containing protein [Brevibacillus agri]MED4572984.1 pentapeptide repeat-containing protein [Brevibacillus agri]WHX29506.1 pentapeptide repeat-containing protein [Brevibacillus agri]